MRRTLTVVLMITAAASTAFACIIMLGIAVRWYSLRAFYAAAFWAIIGATAMIAATRVPPSKH